MLYEVKVSYKMRDENGRDVLKKEWYVLEHCDRFCEAEEKAFCDLEYDNRNELDVTDIKRSRVKELANGRSSADDKVFLAEIKDTFTKDDGTEKDIRYKILFFALDFDKAKSFISEYIKQGYSMLLVSLKETKFVDVL